MRKIIVSVAVVAILVGLCSFYSTAQGQNGSSAAPHRVGLIDMAHVFKEYKKFEVLREDLKADIQGSDRKAKQMAQQIAGLQKMLKSKQLKETSPEYVKREKELIQLTSEFEAFRKSAQRDFLRKESQIYKTIYLEVADAVEKYADYYKYTLILRFNRKGLEQADKPPEVIQRMNRQVVYFRAEDDITDPVLRFLNDRYAKTNPARGQVRQSQGTKKSAGGRSRK